LKVDSEVGRRIGQLQLRSDTEEASR
jgi:hypothetical protein